MRILRLGSSNDQSGRVEDGQMAYRLVEQRLAAELGESVETILKPAWPNARLPLRVEEWVEEYRPDVVWLQVTAYPFTYESVPLKFERRFGRAGRPVARAGLKIADTPWIAHTSPYHLVRRLATRVIGGVTYFEPEQVADRVEACIRMIVRSEDVVLVVRGPRASHGYHVSAGHRRRAEARRLIVHGRLETLCRDLHVDYFGAGAPLYWTVEQSVIGDGIHHDAKGQARAAEEQASFILAAWHRHHGGGF